MLYDTDFKILTILLVFPESLELEIKIPSKCSRVFVPLKQVLSLISPNKINFAVH